MVFQGGVDLEEVVGEEGVVGGHASKPWPHALMLCWYAMSSRSVILLKKYMFRWLFLL